MWACVCELFWLSFVFIIIAEPEVVVFAVLAPLSIVLDVSTTVYGSRHS